MPTPRKCLLTMLGEQLTPMMKRTVGNPEIACDLDERLLTRLCKFHCFYLEFLSECSLRLFHGPFPFCGGPLFQVYLPHFLGSRPQGGSLLIAEAGLEREKRRARNQAKAEAARKVGSIGLDQKPLYSRNDMPISSSYMLGGSPFRLFKSWQRRSR